MILTTSIHVPDQFDIAVSQLLSRSKFLGVNSRDLQKQFWMRYFINHLKWNKNTFDLIVGLE